MNRLIFLFRAITLCLLIPLSSFASLSGSFTVGPGGYFPTLVSALDSLARGGLTGDVTLKVHSAVQVGPFLIGDMPGSDQFTLSVTPNNVSVIILVTPDTTQPILKFDNAHRINLSGLRITSPAVSSPAVSISNSSSNIILANCSLYGRGYGRVVEITGPQTGKVLLDNCQILRGGDGVYLHGQAGSASGNILRDCVIDSVRQGVYLSRQTNCRIEGCEIRANSGDSGGSTAISIGTQSAFDSVYVLGNSLSEIRATSGYAIAIRHNPITSTAYLQVSNNFIYGFQNTGSSQVRAVYLSGGQNHVINNSILVNDVTATGTAYAIYNGLITPAASLTLLNNILVNQEATRTAYNLFNLTSAAPLVSNHNLFFGTGSSYQLGWYLQAYPTLAAWHTGTGFDAKSRQGDPQFVSSTDLHLLETSELPHQNGAVVYNIAADKDREPRFQPPDIGADEYTFLAPSHDVAILNVLGMPEAFPEFSLLRLEVVVQNRGSASLAGLPLRLSYDDTARAEVLVSIPPSVADTFLLLWSTGAAHPSSDLIIEAVLGTDANPSDNARPFSFAITGQPLSGIFQISPGSEFTTLTEATQALTRRGVNGPVTLELNPGLYNESLILESISGLNAAATLTIRPAPNLEGIVLIAPASGAQVALLSNVSHVNIEGIILQGNGAILETVKLANNSHHNGIRDCRIICGSIEQTSAAAVHVSSGCSHNTFEGLDISTAYRGLRFEGGSASSDSSNVVRDCNIYDVRTAIYAAWQNNLLIEECDIAPGYANAQVSCYGIRVSNLRSADTVRVLNNRVMNGQSAATVIGISCESGSGALFAANNWIGQFQPTTSGPVTALSVSSGTAYFYHNSISLGNMASNQVTGVAVSGAQTSVRLLNNIITISEPDATARFIEWTGGAITSNNNLFDAPGSNTEFRFAHSSLDGEYASLSAWTVATGQDSNSVATPAGFVSATDLHIRPDASGSSGRGQFLPEVMFDMDGEARDAMPDIGADEYTFTAVITDLAVGSVGIPELPVMSDTQVYILTAIYNVGQNPVANASATLYYNEIAIGSQAVSLASGESVELIWEWLTPVTSLSNGTLRIEVAAQGDAIIENNSQSQAIVVAGQPLADSVSVGSNGLDFTTLAELAEHLKWRGIDSGLEVILTEETYAEPLLLDRIPGADSLRRVVIRPQTGVSPTVTASNTSAVITLRNADFVELRDLEVVTGFNTQVGILLDLQSCYNSIVRCIVTGTGSGNLSSTGIRVAGEACHGNQILNCSISSCYIGVALTGNVALLSRDNLVGGNDIQDVYFGVWVDRQQDAIISQNQIRPGSTTGPAGACYGVYVVQLGESGSARVNGNWIHDFRDSGGPGTNRATGVYSAPGILSSVEIVNNFIYGFSQLTTLRVRGIYLSSGTHLVANNSIRLDNTASNNETAGIFVSTGTQHEVYNNCVMGYETDVPSFGLDIESGADVLSDYNCFWGNSANFSFAANGAQTYPTLSAWQATGQDAQSLSQHASYVSSSDLHVRVTDSTLFARGLSLPALLYDIDGDARFATPCIGADEYLFQSSLDAPLGLTIHILDENDVGLNWQAVPGASLYRVFGAMTISELESAPTEVGFTSETTWEWDFSADPVGMRFFNVRAE